jgi:hypothetical protein
MHFVAHGVGTVATGSARGSAEAAVFEAMRAYEFDAMGATVSHWDFYIGFDLLVGAGILFHAALLWQLGSLARDEPTRARPFIAICLAAYAVFVALHWAYFFAGPILISTGILVCLGLALLLSPADEPF